MEVSKIILPSTEGPIQVGIKDTVARQAIAGLDVTPDVTDNDVTLEWGTLKEIATIGELSIHVTLPNNPSVNQIEQSEKGVANGVATLDANGKVPASQLPSYVDDVIEGYYYEGAFYEESSHTTQIVAETGKIYIDLSTNKSYRWGGSTMVEIAGGGGSVHGKITVDLIALINGAQASASLLNGVQITLTNTTRSRQVGTQTWAGQTITFDELTPMENYSVAVSNWDSSIWAAETSQQTITSLGIASTENVQFEFEADEYTCTVIGSSDGRVVVSGTEYANGETFRISKGSTITATAKAVQNYVSDITTSNKTITATYTAYGTITVSTLSNQGADSTIEAVTPIIKVGDAAAVNYTTPVQVAPDALVVITWPAVSGYKAPAQQTVVKNGTTNETVSGTYQTEVVTVTVGTDENGVTAEGQIITINGSNYTVGSTGVVTAKVPFDAVYSISANAWTGQDDYTAPESQTNITAAIASRAVTMTYEKIRGTWYNLIVTDNQNGDSGAATDATVTVTYLDGTSTVTLGTTYKSGDSFLIPNGGTNVTVTGNASFGSYTNKNFAPSTELSNTTYTVTYKAQKVTVTSNSSIALTLTSSSSTIASGTSTSISGYVAWGKSWSVDAEATTSVYPTSISPSSGTADSASASVSVTMTSYTLITSGAADLGLPSGKLWAATNVGASNYYDDGLYFSWGDTAGHAANSGYDFSSENYSSGASGSGHNLTGDIPSGNATYDAATANMGGGWRTPTKTEYEELINNCTWIWATLDGVTGRIVINGGKGIFLPASGYYNGTSLSNRGSYGYYWSTRYNSSSIAYVLYFSSSDHLMYYFYRRYGFSVRAIKDPEALDMGNGVQWATGNLCKSTDGTYYIGAPTEYGAYFSWGDINGHYEGEGYNFSSTNYSSGTSGSGHNLTANFTSGDATYDAARAKLGGTWRIPTYDELNWLVNNCTWTWKASGNTDYNGVAGYEVVGTNGNKVFMPASGYYDGTSLGNKGSSGYYWSTRYGDSSDAYLLVFNSSYHYMSYYDRRYGFSVRPVK